MNNLEYIGCLQVILCILSIDAQRALNLKSYGNPGRGNTDQVQNAGHLVACH